MNGPYYHEYLLDVMREIISRYHVEGFTDNSWAGPGRKSVCYCQHCRTSFGHDLPQKPDWTTPSTATGSAELPVPHPQLGTQQPRHARSRRPRLPLARHGQRQPVPQPVRRPPRYRFAHPRAHVRHQSRDSLNGFEQNAANGKLLHAISSNDALIPESMAMYVRGDKAFRIAANPAAESRLWMLEGIAGGISPWWHHISAHREDGRQHDTAEPVMRWHEENAEYLVDREPIADVAMSGHTRT